MSAQPTLTWEQYQQLPPDQRRRPLTSAEYAALTKSQRQAAGLEDSDEGAPANFAGPVFPNPNHVQPQLDTDNSTPVTRLPNGVSFQKGNYQGGAQPDVSNPPTTQATPETVGANMSAAPVKLPAGATLESSGDMKLPPGASLESAGAGKSSQPSVMQVLTQPTAKTDKEYMSYTGPAGVAGATIHGMNEVAQGTKDAIKGAYDSIAQPPQDKTETAVSMLSPGALPIYRMLRGLGHTAADATHVAAAIHDINQSADPLSAYADVAEKTAAQGAGQALVALGTEGAAKAAPAVADTLASPTKVTAPVRAAVKAANTVLEKAPGSIGASAGAAAGHATGLPGAAEIGGAAGYALGKEILPQVKIPGEGFGLPNRVEGGPTGEPQYQPPASQAAAPAAAQAQPAAAATPPAKVSPAILEQQLNDALGGKPLQPGVPLKNQGASAARATLPEGFTPVESSSLLKGYKYSPDTQEFDAILQNGQRFRHGEVTPDQFQAFEDADSKGKAWNDLRAAPGVTPLGKVDAAGTLQPRIKPRTIEVDPETGKPEFSDVVAAKSQSGAAETKAATGETGSGNPETEDLTSLLQKSLDQVNSSKAAASSIPEEIPRGGVMTSAAPADLMKRWGVTGNSVADTDANLRGMNLKQSQEYVNKLAESYKNGRPVEPVLETRDANNNIVDVDGRHRALAAQKAGIERIPILVRRLGVTAEAPEELEARPQ